MRFMPASIAGRRARLLLEPAPERAAAHHLADRRAVERRRHALARHVAERDDQRVGFRRQEVAQVAAELARRIEVPRDVHAAQALRQLLRQQRHLHALGEAAVPSRSALRWRESTRTRRAFSIATAASEASSVSSLTCFLLNAFGSGLSRSNTPMQRSFSSSGTTSSERTPGTALM